jgi:hypothetical protein
MKATSTHPRSPIHTKFNSLKAINGMENDYTYMVIGDSMESIVQQCRDHLLGKFGNQIVIEGVVAEVKKSLLKWPTKKCWCFLISMTGDHLLYVYPANTSCSIDVIRMDDFRFDKSEPNSKSRGKASATQSLECPSFVAVDSSCNNDKSPATGSAAAAIDEDSGAAVQEDSKDANDIPEYEYGDDDGVDFMTALMEASCMSPIPDEEDSQSSSSSAPEPEPEPAPASASAPPSASAQAPAPPSTPPLAPAIDACVEGGGDVASETAQTSNPATEAEVQQQVQQQQQQVQQQQQQVQQQQQQRGPAASGAGADDLDQEVCVQQHDNPPAGASDAMESVDLNQIVQTLQTCKVVDLADWNPECTAALAKAQLIILTSARCPDTMCKMWTGWRVRQQPPCVSLPSGCHRYKFIEPHMPSHFKDDRESLLFIARIMCREHDGLLMPPREIQWTTFIAAAHSMLERLSKEYGGIPAYPLDISFRGTRMMMRFDNSSIVATVNVASVTSTAPMMKQHEEIDPLVRIQFAVPTEH